MKIVIYDTLTEYAKEVRQKVFVEEQGFHEEFDETDDRAWHIMMFDGDKPIANCRVFESGQKGTFILGRLAVLKEYRGKDYGSELVKEAETLVTQKGGSRITLHAQCRVQKFYNTLGFQEYGTADEEEGCPHIWMEKYL